MELRRKMRKAAINRGYLATVLAGDGGGRNHALEPIYIKRSGVRKSDYLAIENKV